MRGITEFAVVGSHPRAHGGPAPVRWLCGLLGVVTVPLVLLLMVPAHASAAYTFGSEVTAVGSKTTVFDHATFNNDTQQCNDLYFIQDTVSRAFRDPSGVVQLIVAHAGTPDAPQGHTRRLTGGNLNGVAVSGTLPTSDPRCGVIHTSENDPDPDLFNNWEWMVSPFTEDGQNISTLVHNEYHGWEFSPQRCPTSQFAPRCWYNQITLAKSTNRGALYTRAAAPAHFIAGIPYQYSSDLVPGGAGSKGYFQPTNVVKRGGWYYTMFRAEKYQLQPSGTCVMRTNNLDDPTSWRAWGDGDGNAATPDTFDVQMVSAYPTEPLTDAEKLRRMCKPVDTQFSDPPTEVAPNTISRMAGNLVWSRYFGKWMLIDAHAANVNGVYTPGVYYATSSDLINWDPLKLLMAAPLAWDRPCPSPDRGIRPPGLLDPNSADRNYNTIGQTADLYFVESRFVDDTSVNPPRCSETLDRDLVRIPIRFDKKPAPDRLATFEGGSIIGSTGVEWWSNGSSGTIFATSERAYDGSKSLKLYSGTGTSAVYGGFTARNADGAEGWPTGTDVWYGSGFYLPTGFRTQVPRVMPMRWLNSTMPQNPSRYGGIVLNTDDTYRLIRGVQGGPEDNLGGTFTLPEGRWFFLEVRQKLESDPSKNPLSEVYVDGNLVATSAAPNSYPNGDGVPVRVHYGYAQRSFMAGTVAMWLDRPSISTMQRGPLGAPAIPTGVRGTEGSTHITLSSDGSPDIGAGGGYRIYQEQGGVPALVQQGASPGYLATFQTNCSRLRYRMSAYKATGEESPLSEEIELRPQPANGCP
jgi:hypothetical protein